MKLACMLSIALLVLVSKTANADAPSRAEQYAASARTAAEHGNCDHARFLAKKARKADSAAVDAELTALLRTCGTRQPRAEEEPEEPEVVQVRIGERRERYWKSVAVADGIAVGGLAFGAWQAAIGNESLALAGVGVAGVMYVAAPFVHTARGNGRGFLASLGTRAAALAVGAFLVISADDHAGAEGVYLLAGAAMPVGAMVLDYAVYARHTVTVYGTPSGDGAVVGVAGTF